LFVESKKNEPLNNRAARVGLYADDHQNQNSPPQSNTSSATTLPAQVVDNWMYEQTAQPYALDADMQDFFEQSNPWALQAISVSGYWRPRSAACGP